MARFSSTPSADNCAEFADVMAIFVAWSVGGVLAGVGAVVVGIVQVTRRRLGWLGLVGALLVSALLLTAGCLAVWAGSAPMPASSAARLVWGSLLAVSIAAVLAGCRRRGDPWSRRLWRAAGLAVLLVSAVVFARLLLRIVCIYA